MKSALLISALGFSLANANVIVCEKPYGCAGHNINTMTCNDNEDCSITCSDSYACRDLDIYGPTNELSDDKLSLTIDCTSQYSCYGVTLHTENLDTIKVQCTDWWSCAYMTIDGKTANQVFVYVPDEGYYSFGSGRVYCPISTENENNKNENDENNENNENNEIIVDNKNTETEISCSIECNGEKSCYHSKFHSHNGLIDNKLVLGCNGGLSCNFAKLYCNYDNINNEWLNQCTMSCNNDENCSCQTQSDCMTTNNENNIINDDEEE